MQYRQVIPARSIARPNRFVAHTETADGPVTVHVKNTGRCAELLRPGATVWLTPGENPARKTPYDLIAVESPPTGARSSSTWTPQHPTRRRANGWLLEGLAR